MAFEPYHHNSKVFQIIKRHHHASGEDSDSWINDAGSSRAFHFECKNCSDSLISIDEQDALSFYNLKPKINSSDLIKHGGAGQMYKYIRCKECQTIYYIGFGAIEPNNSRSVVLVHTILEVR